MLCLEDAAYAMFYRDQSEALLAKYFAMKSGVTQAMLEVVINRLREDGHQYLVAPYEADAQLAYLQRNRLLDGVLTLDGDLFLYGATEVVLDYNLETGKGQLYDLKDEANGSGPKKSGTTFNALFKAVVKWGPCVTQVFAALVGHQMSPQFLDVCSSRQERLCGLLTGSCHRLVPRLKSHPKSQSPHSPSRLLLPQTRIIISSTCAPGDPASKEPWIRVCFKDINRRRPQRQRRRLTVEVDPRLCLGKRLWSLFS